MPPKRKAQPRANGRDQWNFISGSDASQYKAQLDAGEELDTGSLLKLLHADQACEALYSKSCKWKGSSPNCFCGIIPLPNGFRKHGLWAKSAKDALIGSQNNPVDPSESRRESLSKPAGLRNLGSTCYVNAVLQFLFSVTAFRNAVFSASPAVVADDPVVSTLRHVFVSMMVGPTDPVDPGRLIEALQLDHAVQQDGQEFMKLFLSLLEQRFSAVDCSPFRKTIPGLFRGRAGYVTVCQSCRQPSASSLRHDNFYELDVPVRGYSSLQDSLQSLLSPELLCGDNQYFCEHCHSKQDATRQLRISVLPPLLCISLQRFVFDMTKLDRVKVNDKFAFPTVLPPSWLLGGDNFRDDGTLWSEYYDLEAILVHKGMSARHGHYVAHIKMEDLSWWKFDDESVSEMKDGIVSLMGKDKSASDDRGVASTGLNSMTSPSSVASQQEECCQEGLRKELDSIVSTNAYLLVYRRRGAKLDGPELDQEISTWLETTRATLEQEYAERCAKFAEAKEEAERVVTCRRLEVRQLIEEAADDQCIKFGREQSENELTTAALTTKSTDDPGRFVYAPWLQAWADSIDAGSIPQELNNTRLLCEHGKLDPSLWTVMKRLPTHVWHHLGQSCKFGTLGPELTPKDMCYTCLSSILSHVSSAQDFEEAREREVKLATEVLEGDGEFSEDYIVSRPWLMAWVRRQGRGMGTTSPTAALVCPHSKQAPAHASTGKSRQVAIPAELWVYLKGAWNVSQTQKAKALKKKNENLHKSGSKSAPSMDNVIDLVNDQQREEHSSKDDEEWNGIMELAEFPVNDATVCHECLENMNVTASKQSGQQLRKESERAQLGHLVDQGTGLMTPLRPGQPYCLVPRSFMEHWRSYLAPTAVLEPPDLKDYTTMSLCRCHPGPTHPPLLAYPPPHAVQLRGRWVVDDRNRNKNWEEERERDIDRYNDDQDNVSSYFEVITPGDWDVLISLYCPEVKELNILKDPINELMVSGIRATFLLSEGEEGSVVGKFVTEPALCLEAVNERRKARRQARLTYSNAEVIVEVVEGEEDALLRSKASCTSSQRAGFAHERKSKRARKGRAPVVVDSSLLVSDFLLRIFQALGVHPRNARLFVGGRRLEGSELDGTLAQCEIFPGEEIFVADSGEYDADDYSGLFGASSTPPGNNKGNGRLEGFSGTILSGLG